MSTEPKHKVLFACASSSDQQFIRLILREMNNDFYNKLPRHLATSVAPQNLLELIKKFVAEPTDQILHLYGQPSATVCVLLGDIKWLSVTDKGVARAQHLATGNIIEFH